MSKAKAFRYYWPSVDAWEFCYGRSRGCQAIITSRALRDLGLSMPADYSYARKVLGAAVLGKAFGGSDGLRMITSD